ADLVEHRLEQGRLVLAVSVTMAEYFGSRMRAVAADSDLNGGITNVLLRKASERTDAIHGRHGSRRKLLYLLLQRRACVKGPAADLGVPRRQFAPILVRLAFEFFRYESHDHVTGQRPIRRAFVFLLDGGNVREFPDVCAIFSAGLQVGMVNPVVFHLPSGGNAKDIAASFDRHRPLEKPAVFKNVGASAALKFETHY